LLKICVSSKTVFACACFTIFLSSLVFGQASPSSKFGGELVLSTTSDPKSFNDIIAKETSTTLVTGHIFEGLTTTNAFTTKVEPHLAKSWEVSEDGLRWTFYLRKDVLWNDGQPFTADDVIFTFNDLVYNPLNILPSPIYKQRMRCVDQLIVCHNIVPDFIELLFTLVNLEINLFKSVQDSYFLNR